MSFLNDAFNMFLADASTPNGGDRYLMYTIFRSDIESRISKKQSIKRREELLRKIEESEKRAIKARKDKERAEKAEEKYREDLRKCYLSYVGCETFDEMCTKLDLKQADNWKRFVEVMPEYAFFNEEHKRLYE